MNIAFPPVRWHSSWFVLSPLAVYPPPQTQTRLHWDDHFVLTRAWWLPLRLQRIWYDSNYRASPTWHPEPDPCMVVLGNTPGNQILPSSPGPVPLMAVKSSFFSDSPAVSSSVAPIFYPLFYFSSYETFLHNAGEIMFLFFFSKYQPHFPSYHIWSLIHILLFSFSYQALDLRCSSEPKYIRGN